MIIADIVGYALSSPYGKGITLGHPLGLKSIGLVEVYTDTGRVGTGETYAGVYAPELIEPVVTFLKRFLLGLDVENQDLVRNRVAHIPFIGRNGIISSVYSAIDIALWDLKGKAAGKPIWALLNGNRYRDGVNLYASGGSAALEPADIEAELDRVLERGFDSYKMRVGLQDWSTDLERVAVARSRLGESRRLMIDAIMGTHKVPWNLETAAARAADLASVHPFWLEEPLYPGDVAAHAQLRAATSIPIASGEALTGLWEFAQYLHSDGLDIVQPDVTHCGGFSVARDVLRLAGETNTRVAMHVWGSSVAFTANAHFALAFPEVEYLEVPTVPLEVSAQIDPEFYNLSGSSLKAPGKPGLGIELTPETKKHYNYVPETGYRL